MPKMTRAVLPSNPNRALNGEIKRGTEIVGIFPAEAARRRLGGAILLRQNDEWGRYSERFKWC
jgi:putative transposase